MTRSGAVAALLSLLWMGAAVGCAAGTVIYARPGARQVGEASWYGARFHGRTTASGEPFNMHAMTAAHPTLPFGTRCRVTNQRNGRSIIVRINDRGPFAKGRIIDLSRAAAAALGFIRAGHVPVSVEVVP